MDKFIAQLTEVFTTDKYVDEFLSGIWDTAYSTVVATAVAFLLGLPQDKAEAAKALTYLRGQANVTVEEVRDYHG